MTNVSVFYKSKRFFFFLFSFFQHKMEFELLAEEITPLLTNQDELNESGEKKPSPWYIIIPVFTLSFAYGYE
jgi:hypothetical protein